MTFLAAPPVSNNLGRKYWDHDPKRTFFFTSAADADAHALRFFSLSLFFLGYVANPNYIVWIFGTILYCYAIH